ncbi:MAG: hypothetical protein WC292_07370 [Clostridia bacterium]
MSKKKRLAAARAEEERLAATTKKTVKKPIISYRVMNNSAPVPVAKPSDFIQLTPIVQPVPIVPYSSQLQPLAMFDEEEGY